MDTSIAGGGFSDLHAHYGSGRGGQRSPQPQKERAEENDDRPEHDGRHDLDQGQHLHLLR